MARVVLRRERVAAGAGPVFVFNTRGGISVTLLSRPMARALLVWALVLSVSTAAAATILAAQGTPDASPVASPAASPEASPVAGDLGAFLQTPVGQQFSWVLAALNGEEDLSPDAYEARFDPSFVQAVPYDDFMVTFDQLVASGPWTPTEVAPGATDLAAEVTIQGTGSALVLQIAVGDTTEHLIYGLTAQPAAPPTWEEIDAGLSGFGSTVGLLAAELSGTSCTPVHELNADKPLAIGSVFKLYILGELGRQIAAGERTWNDQIAIDDAYRSVPSGDLAFAPAGAVYTLRYLAEVMISQSDNTATDHLLFALGRENVEAMVATMGHADSSLMIPMLSTRELFAIKMMMPPDRQRAYIDAGPDERRAMLDGEIKAAADAMVAGGGPGLTSPTFVDSVEWFASPADMCAAMAYLADQSNQPGLLPLREVLQLNPGAQIDRTVWPVVGFKGGSEAGVIALTWLLQRADGRWFVVAAGVNDTTHTIDERGFADTATLAIGALAQTP
jgi:beta-lactamase class A